MVAAVDDSMTTIDRLLAATAARDVDGIARCFAEDYELESPLHPARSFRGRDQVRRTWTAMFDAVPDLKAALVRRVHDGEWAWTEWEMTGTRRDGVAHDLRGVFIFRIRDGIVRSGRMYLEPVDHRSENMDRAVRDLLEGK
jgi:ketosteroid isomerase-like protein